MGDKKIEALEVEVDELALSLVGWQVDEVQARLVTESFGKADHFQQIAVSGTMRFLSEDWTERFERSDHVPSPHLVLNRRGAAVAPSFEWVLIETEKKASKRPLRISRTSSTWECKKPLRPDDLSLKLTAYDLDYLDTDFELPPAKAQSIPLELLEETSLDSIRTKVSKMSAHILRGEYRGKVRVHLEGAFEFGTADDLLADYLAAEEWRDADATLEDTCPFEVDVPCVVIEVLDEGGFLLEKHEFSITGHIPVGQAGKLPGRPARWAVQAGMDVDDLAGEPARAVARIVDAEDL